MTFKIKISRTPYRFWENLLLWDFSFYRNLLIICDLLQSIRHRRALQLRRVLSETQSSVPRFLLSFDPQ